MGETIVGYVLNAWAIINDIEYSCLNVSYTCSAEAMPEFKTIYITSCD